MPYSLGTDAGDADPVPDPEGETLHSVVPHDVGQPLVGNAVGGESANESAATRSIRGAVGLEWGEVVSGGDAWRDAAESNRIRKFAPICSGRLDEARTP